MAKRVKMVKASGGPGRLTLELEKPTLPADFRGAQYGNKVTIGATSQEVFLDLLQLGPEAGGGGEGRAIFVGRFIFPLIIAKGLISDLQRFVNSIERDTGVKLPEPEELRE
ncbi:hypothetical protein ACFLUZ_02695 [Chloroflexota bacterium]